MQVTIHTDNFKQLNKRLLLQPITFNVLETPKGCQVTMQDDKALSFLIKHITDTIHETLVKEEVHRLFVEQGAYSYWVNNRLLSKLPINDMEGPWKKEIKNDISHLVENALEVNCPVKLTAYLRFRTTNIREQVKKYATEMEELVFFGVIEGTLSAMDTDSPNHEVPSCNAVKLIGTPLDMKFYSEDDVQDTEKRIELFNSSDFVDEIANLYAETVYLPDSNRYKEAQFYTYTLMIMKRWGVKKWIVPSTIYEALETYRRRLDIAVLIEQTYEH